MPAPDTVYVDDSVCADCIDETSVLHPGTRLIGGRLSIGPDCEIGAEGPATVIDCQLGANVALKGGYYEDAVFLDGASVGSCAHVRPGCLLEEQAECAHAVGIKQTILLPFMVTGSLVNFCDILMSGGTSRANHSEVGSSYIHFNYTPHGDKATASLVGDVPRGVMLDQPPIFLGGQGGLVGPARIEFGCVIPAGAVWRGDALEGGMICYPPDSNRPAGPRSYRAGMYKRIGRLVRNNLLYIGNIAALKQWYVHVRRSVMQEPFRLRVWEGALRQLDAVIEERIKRLGQVAEKMPESIALAQAQDSAASYIEEQRHFADAWPGMEEKIRALCAADIAPPGDFMQAWTVASADSYIQRVSALSGDAKRSGTAWLMGMVDQFSALA